jgi:hypothetical protein
MTTFPASKDASRDAFGLRADFSPPDLSISVSVLLGIRQGFGRVIKVKKPLYLHTVKVEVKV